MATTTIFDIASESTEAGAGDYFVIDSLVETKKIHRDNAFKKAALSKYSETVHDYGNGSGTFQHDADTYGNNCKLNMTGDLTVDVPLATLAGEQAIGGIMIITGGDSYNITWSANYDFGDAGVPAAAATLIIVYYRRAGETITTARAV